MLQACFLPHLRFLSLLLLWSPFLSAQTIQDDAKQQFQTKVYYANSSLLDSDLKLKAETRQLGTIPEQGHYLLTDFSIEVISPNSTISAETLDQEIVNVGKKLGADFVISKKRFEEKRNIPVIQHNDNALFIMQLAEPSFQYITRVVVGAYRYTSNAD
ncbi:MAG: hypothetical protein OEZ47_09155 [Gammaproteobacteria bacterium]|nr:hypothetical protein [Gammaproteobacteria bacterium]